MELRNGTRPTDFITSKEGTKVQRQAWNETTDEMSKVTTLPSWMKKI